TGGSADSRPANHRSTDTRGDQPSVNYRSSAAVPNEPPNRSKEKPRDYYRTVPITTPAETREVSRDAVRNYETRPHVVIERRSFETAPPAQSPSLQDEVFTNGSPVPAQGPRKKIVYRIPDEMVRVRQAPNEYDYPPAEAPGARIVDRSNLLRTVSTSSEMSAQDSPIRRLLSTHLDGDPTRVQKVSRSGAGLPSPVVKTTILRCSNGRKAAIIQVDEIARIIRWIDPSEENGSVDHNVDIRRSESTAVLDSN
ncbi:hypothetical protein PFISCL1PPCAC_8990, partial [Pristionchus fissidentatus]